MRDTIEFCAQVLVVSAMFMVLWVMLWFCAYAGRIVQAKYDEVDRKRDEAERDAIRARGDA